MGIKKLYYYWFYKYYSFLEKYDQTRWRSHTNAMFTMLAAELLLLYSITTYIEIVIFSYSGKPGPGLAVFVILGMIPTVITIQAFGGDKWKKHIKEFEEWDTVNKNKGTWIVAIVTGAIFLNFFISISLWRQLQGWSV